MYIRGLDFNHIRLNDESDSLLWSYSKYVGPIIATLGYDSLFHTNGLAKQNKELTSLWKLKIPLKIICFSWLLVYEWILTWDHLQSRVFFVPSRCVL